MNRPYVFLLAAIFFAMGLVVPGFGQTRLGHFTYAANTGNNATIGIPPAANPNVAGTSLATGDEIGVFTPDGLCVGAAVWTAGASAAITVWGDNDQTPAVDGIRAGEQMSFCVWRRATNTAYSEVNLTYSLGDGRYSVNGIFAVSSLTASNNLTAPLAPHLASPSQGATNTALNPGLQWYSACTARTYRVQVSLNTDFSSFVVDRGEIDSTFYQFSRLSPLAANTTYYWRVRATNTAGAGPWSTIWNFTTGLTVDIEETPVELPQTFVLHQNFPNPFNAGTIIEYAIQKPGTVEVRIYNELGQPVRILVNENKPRGSYRILWDGNDSNGQRVATGHYFYQLRGDDFVSAKRMLLLK